MPHRSRTPYFVVAVGILIACALMGLCVLQLLQSRLDALERARDASRNIGLIAERDIARNFELYDLSLQAVSRSLQRPEVMALPAGLRDDILFDHSMTAQFLGATLVMDSAGDIVLDSGSDVPRKGNFADRKYFTIHRDNPNAGLYVSAPYKSRLRGGTPSIALSRRLSHPNGTFAGIVVLAVDLEYFHKLFAGLSLGPHGSIALISRDGILIMRQSYDARTIGRDLSQAATFRRFRAATEGTFTETSSIDGVRRLYYFKNLPNLPVIITVAEAEQDIYAAWRRRAVTIGLLVAAFGIGFIALSAVLAVQLRRRMRAESELVLLARTDGLTGLNNRRSFGEVLDREWHRARRARSVFSLLFVDVDRFKAYNDTYGHQAGDDALAAVARCIGANIRRPVDTAARYGGEEFVVLLPDTPQTGAAQIAERIRAAIDELALEHAGSEYGRVTASIGLASWTPDHDGEAGAVIKAADEALYYAKATGRNKIAAFQHPPNGCQAPSRPVFEAVIAERSLRETVGCACRPSQTLVPAAANASADRCASSTYRFGSRGPLREHAEVLHAIGDRVDEAVTIEAPFAARQVMNSSLTRIEQNFLHFARLVCARLDANSRLLLAKRPKQKGAVAPFTHATRKRSRFFASLIQAGARPRPLHVSPVLGFWYLAATVLPLLAR